MRRPDLPMVRRALVMAFMAASLVGWGCSGSQDACSEFAQSAPSSGLALTVKMAPTAPVPGAAAAPVRSIATSLALVIGERGAADTLAPPPFPLTGAPGETLSFTIGNIPPGLRKPVGYRATDAAGRVVSNGLYYLDFLPGQLTSNDVDLGVPGGGTGGPLPVPGYLAVTLNGTNQLVKVDPTTGTYTTIKSGFASPPHSVCVDSATGDYVVTEENVMGVVSRVTASGGYSPVSTGSSLAYPMGIVQSGDGNFVVNTKAVLCRVNRATGHVSTT